MSAKEIDGQLCYCPNSLFDPLGNNNWAYPVFVDTSKVPSATLQFNSSSSSIQGSLVIPIPKPASAGSLYATFDENNRIVPPSVSSPNAAESQVVFVPKGMRYNIFNSKRMNVSGLEGFLVIPIGDTSFNQSQYDSFAINIENYTNYSVTDERGNNYQVD